MRAAVVLATVAILSQRAGADPTPASAADTKLAQAVIASWLDVQIRADFTAYQALYAPAFTGVKRVGTQVKKLDRAGWIKDRKTMFKATMAVAATNLAITTDGGAVIVDFDQRWEQGSYADLGKKRLTIDRATRAITAEEMLTSRVLLTGPACVKLLFPTAAKGRIGPDSADDAIASVDVTDLGSDRFVCRLQHGADGSHDATVEVAAIRRVKGWKLIEKVEHDIANDRTADPIVFGEVEVSTFALTPTVSAVVVTARSGETGMHTGHSKEATAVYLITPTALAEQVAFESTSQSDAEDSTGTDCELAVTAKKHKGYPDLAVTCTVTHPGDWWNEDVDKRGQKQDRSTTTYRWDGTHYAER